MSKRHEKVLVCDRCNHEATWPARHWTSVQVGPKNGSGRFKHLDLCARCTGDLVNDWLPIQPPEEEPDEREVTEWLTFPTEITHPNG